MKLATIDDNGTRTAVLVDPARGVVPAASLLPDLPAELPELFGSWAELEAAAKGAADALFRPETSVRFVAPYLHPRKIWGIGLNYVEHAADLDAVSPTDEPASFIKGDHTIIGNGDAIVLPEQSERVTAEAEIGLVIGRECRNVSEEDALDYVWGACSILDQTAEDILQKNPRFLTRSKNFPTFFSFGPTITPLSELGDDLDAIVVNTVRNGVVERTNTVSNMTFGLRYLVSFHSKVMPLFPGDIISTGTPGAVVIRSGDVMECRVDGLDTLRNSVV